MAKVQFWRFSTGPDLLRRRLFSRLLCLARILRNVTKMGQHGSGSPRASKTALGCISSILVILNRSGPLEKRPFFQSCAVDSSPTIEKCDQNGSAWVGSPRAPKTALGCKSLILAIHERFGTVKKGLFFKAALSSPNVEKCDQNGSVWVRVL